MPRKKYKTGSAKKRDGKVFTPEWLVDSMLNDVYATPEQVLGKHVMDNSCGNGAFLRRVVFRYAHFAREAGQTDDEIRAGLEKYVHGIEIDPVTRALCVESLDREISASFGITGVEWDVRLGDALEERRYDGMMDLVVGNPPYVRVHNIENLLSVVKDSDFAKGGMTDMYLAFYQLGLRMLRPGGWLFYAAPGSWTNSVAGAGLRKYLSETRSLAGLVDFGHFQAFQNATTYTMLALVQKDVPRDAFAYCRFDESLDPDAYTKCFRKVADLKFEDAFAPDRVVLGIAKDVAWFRKIAAEAPKEPFKAKNGLCTLADDVFIKDSFPFKTFVRDVCKASSGKWSKMLFPYEWKTEMKPAPELGLGRWKETCSTRPVPEDELLAEPALREYYEENKDALLKGASEKENPSWRLFGRSQAVKDVFENKTAVCNLVKDPKSLNIEFVPSGAGVYSGLYVLTPFFWLVDGMLRTDRFVRYVRMLGKYKRGGYYAFNAKELQNFLNYEYKRLTDEGVDVDAYFEKKWNERPE